MEVTHLWHTLDHIDLCWHVSQGKITPLIWSFYELKSKTHQAAVIHFTKVKNLEKKKYKEKHYDKFSDHIGFKNGG